METRSGDAPQSNDLELDILGLGLAHEELSRPALLLHPSRHSEASDAPEPAVEAAAEGAPALDPVARDFIEILSEDMVVSPRGKDAPGQLTALGEAQELVGGDRAEAELTYRRALQNDARYAEAQESLRRLHRTAGNWRTLALFIAREIGGAEGERKAHLQLLLELISRGRPESGAAGPLASQTLDPALPASWGRMEAMLRAAHALSLRSVEKALAVRAELIEVDLRDPEAVAAATPEALAASQAWAWSGANLRRFTLRESRAAASLLQAVFESGRRDPELLESLAEVLEELCEWEQLRDVLEEATQAGGSPTLFEALASLHEHRFRDLAAAERTLRAGVERHPEDATLARRHVEALLHLQQEEGLIDALGNQMESTATPRERAALLARMGQLFEEVAGNTSAAMEVFHEALAQLPHHGPTLRALGRIYARQNNPYGLADLYEKELAAPAPLPDAWRRHLRLAELYEDRLVNPTAALRHYLAALGAQPTSLPALEGAARLYSAEGEWEEVVRLYSVAAPRFTSRRRQIELLERAARLCELHLSNDRLLAELLGRLLTLTPESTWAASGLTRLYQRTQQWEALIQHHLREAAYIDDADETATLFWTCGRIAERELQDAARAEGFYREALGAAPDFAPALGALGRLLGADERFEDLLAMSEAELEVLDDTLLRARRMEAMAEILEQRLGRRVAAIELYERIVESGVEETSAVDRLLDLYAEQGRWEQVAELVERKANSLDDAGDAAEQWFRLGELRARRLSDPVGALEAWEEALASDPDHAHALHNILRLASVPERDRDAAVARVSHESATAPTQRLALRHLARRAELTSDNPAAGLELRRQALALDPTDREARDLLEVASAHRRDLPALAGLWAGAGRTLDEGLLGLLCAGAGVESAALLEAFLGRWGEQVEGEGLERDGRRAVWSAALAELSRGGLRALAQAPAALVASLPAALRRRIALAELGAGEGAAGRQRALRALQAAPSPDPASLRLEACLVARDRAARVRALRAEADHLRSPELRVRRLLELAPLDPERRDDLLKRAVHQEAYASPVQERLYEVLEEAEAWELLGEALEGHLCAEDLSAQRRSLLAYRLGVTIEQRGGDPLDALQAYRTSFHACSERHEALLDIARIALQHGDKWDVIRSLEAFMTLSPEQDKRLEAGRFLARMYLAEAERPAEDGGYNPYAGPLEFDGGVFGRKAVALLSQLLEEHRGSAEEVPCASLLAHAHAEVGSPYKAIGIFNAILTSEVPEAQLSDYVTLARLYADPLGDWGKAEQIYALIWDTHPAREELLDGLLAASRANKTLPEVCDLIERTARMAAPEVLTAADRRRLLERVATLQGEELGRWRPAAALWAELADGAADPVLRRKLRVRQAQALCRVAGEESRCHALMLELHREEPLDLAPYEGLETLYREVDDHERLRTIQQIRYVLDPRAAGEIVVDQVRLKTRPTRTFEAELLHAQLLPEGLQGGVLPVLQAMVPLALKLWGEQVPTPESLGGRRLKSGELEHVAEMVTSAAAAFGMPKVKLLMGDSGSDTPQILPGPTLWFHRGMFEGFGPEVARFWAGYAAAMAWMNVSPLTHLDGRDVWHLLEGILTKQLGQSLSEITDPRSAELADAVGGVFNASLRKRVAEVAAPAMGALRQAHCEAWPAMIHLAAVRAGLVLSGQVSGAVLATLRGRQWSGPLHDRDTQEHLRRLPEIADLLRFALSEEYQALRYGCGLSARARRPVI